MKKVFKRTLATFLMVIMLLSVLPLAGIDFTTKASAETQPNSNAAITISGMVWIDEQFGEMKNGNYVPKNGLIDSFEKGLCGTKVSLYNEKNEQIVKDKFGKIFGVNGCIIIDESGKYSFSNLPTGSYYVLFEYDGVNYQAIQNSADCKAKEINREQFAKKFTTINAGQTSAGIPLKYDVVSDEIDRSKLVVNDKNGSVLPQYIVSAQSEVYSSTNNNVNLGLDKRILDIRLDLNIDSVVVDDKKLSPRDLYINGLSIYSDSEIIINYKLSVKLIVLTQKSDVLCDVNCYFANMTFLDIKCLNKSVSLQSEEKGEVSFNEKKYSVLFFKGIPVNRDETSIDFLLSFKVNNIINAFNDLYSEIYSYTTSLGLVDKDSAPNNAIQNGVFKREGDSECWTNNDYQYKVYYDGFEYKIVNDTVSIINYHGFKDIIYIPSTIDGFPVTTIESFAFKDNLNGAKKIVIPSSVTIIRDSAFNGDSFYGNASLENIEICEGLKSIGEAAFINCSNLKYINIPNTVSNISPYEVIIGETKFPLYISFLSLIGYVFDEILNPSIQKIYVNNNSYADNYLKDHIVLQNQINKDFLDYNYTSYYTVNYNCSYNGGDWNTTVTRSAKKGDSVDLSIKSPKYGWTFVGWNTNPNATTGLSSLKMETSDVTLYAIYKKTLTGTFVDYSGTTKQTRTKSVTIYNKASSGTITAPSQNTYTGWTSRGWTTGTLADSGITTNFAISSNITYYGVYQRTLTLSYNANGGSSTPSSKTGTQYTNSYAISSTKNPSFTLASAISKSGSTFSGWAKGSPSGTVYNTGSSIILTENTIMYAMWNLIKYTVNFNGNGGTVSPTSVIVESGKFITLPTPDARTGYTCLGWATSSSATSATYNCGAPYKPTYNITLYAVWKNVTQRFSQNNRFNFSNSSSNFVTSWSGGNYYMTQSDYNKLISYIKKYDSSSSSTISNVQDLMYSEWGGSCYGMASAAVLDYQNKIAFNENFGSGAKTMWDVKSPSTDKNIMSAINYYMVSQEIGFVRNSSSYYDKDYYPSSWTPGLKKLVSTAQKGEPFLFCYYWIEGYYSYGHAIVAYNCKTNSDGSFSITAYDNRYPNKDVIIKVNSSYTSCVVNGDEKAEAFEIYNDMSGFDKIDIDGPKNDMNISYSSYNYSGANDEISVVANGDVTVTNANGETISVVNGDISGTMNILSVHMIVSDTEDGEAAPVEFVFEVGHSKTYMFESTDDKMEVSVKTKNIYGSASSENADCIAIGDDGVYVIGNNMEYSTALSSKDNGYDTVILAGAAKRDVSLTYSGNSILINGVNGKDETITIFAHDEMEPEDYEIKEGYNNVKVDSENNKIDIKGSSNNDGRYDISVVKRNKVNSVSISDIEVNYKSSAKIVPQINGDDGAKYTAKYESSNPSVATVDKDGNITTVHKGSTTITCTVADEYGNTVKDTCTVTVKFQWWQWLIWILLFGFLWY